MNIGYIYTSNIDGSQVVSDGFLNNPYTFSGYNLESREYESSYSIDNYTELGPSDEEFVNINRSLQDDRYRFDTAYAYHIRVLLIGPDHADDIPHSKYTISLVERETLRSMQWTASGPEVHKTILSLINGTPAPDTISDYPGIYDPYMVTTLQTVDTILPRIFGDGGATGGITINGVGDPARRPPRTFADPFTDQVDLGTAFARLRGELRLHEERAQEQDQWAPVIDPNTWILPEGMKPLAKSICGCRWSRHPIYCAC